MATPPFLNGQSPPPPQPRPTKANKPGRVKKPNNKNNPKKPPQRGMGVAQLERLRFQEQERWKKMTEIKSDDIQTQYVPISQSPETVVETVVPLGGYPVQWNYALGVPMISSGLGSGQSLAYPYYGSGAPERMMKFNDNDDDHHHHHHVLESSKELSSIPNLPRSQSQSLQLDCCCNNASCYKKKRTNQKTNNDDQFLGLSLENNFNNGRIKGFDQATYKLNEGVDVVAVHRRARGIVGGNVVMEYDFLHGSSTDRSTPSKELPGFPLNEAASPSVGSSVVGGEASHDAAFSSTVASNPVDLSLKLSF